MPTFSTLWNSYPIETAPCQTNGVSNFVNQCAIRIGVCFEAAGISTDSWTVERCWHHPRKHGHTLRAEDLARFFDSGSLGAKTEKYDGKTGLRNILGRKGIIFFQNYWGSGLTGDHIDLLNDYEMKNRRRFPSIYTPGAGGDYEKGKIWFWPLS